MKNGHWVLLAVVIWVLAFASGYKMSSASGIQPGYFEAAEAGGYGGAGDSEVEGISKDAQDYYKNLYKQEE